MRPAQCFVADLVKMIERIAPVGLAEPWDNVGLQIGDPSAPVRRVMTCLEVTPPVAAEAVRRGADTLVTHHPLIFKSLNSIDLSQPVANMAGRLVRSGLTLIAAHTNLDSARWGTNTVLADRCGFRIQGPLIPRTGEAQYKLAVFAPKGHEDKLIEAIARGGGGRIGAYTHCTFRTPGVGTFRGGEGTDPFMGRAGRLEQVEELRLEAVVPESARTTVVREMLAAHPYEEVAFDLYPLAATPRFEGMGLLTTPEKPMTASQLALDLKSRLGLKTVRLSGAPKKKARRVAVCAGSGGSLLGMVAGRADVLVTGEMDYHRGVEAHARAIAVIELGHFETEVLVTRPLAARLGADPQLAAAGVKVFPADKDLQPFSYL